MSDKHMEALGGTLRHAPIIQALSDAAVTVLFDASERVDLVAGKTLLRQEAVPEAVYLVQSGALRHIVYNPAGTDASLGLVGAGHWLGLGSLYGLPQPSTIEALIDSAVIAIAPQTVQQLMAQDPALARAFHALTLQQSIEVQKRLCEMMTLSVPERLAHCLLRIGREFGRETEQGLYLDVPLTRTHLADLVGTRFETVSRTLSQWERDGLVRSRRQQIWILQQAQLTQLIGT